MKKTINRAFNIPDDSRILVRANNWIGDVVMSTPALHTLKTSFPHASISVLAKPWVVPVLKYNPDIHRILLYDTRNSHKGLAGKNRLVQDLKNQDFHCAILLQRAFEAALVSFTSRIPCRAGFRTDGRSLLLTHRVRAEKEVFRIHRVKHNLEMLSRMGIDPAPDEKLVLPVGSVELKRAQEMMDKIGVGPDTLLLGLNPGATFGSAKRWMPDRFADLTDRIVRDYGAVGVIFGSAGERELGERICDMSVTGRLHNLAGETSLAEAVALIALCGLFVTNDSGLMHVAAALDVPLVSIFGPTDPRATSPWCKRQKLMRREDVPCIPCMERECKEGHHQCMQAVTTDDVYQACKELLSTYGTETTGIRAQKLKVSGNPVPVIDFAETR